MQRTLGARRPATVAAPDDRHFVRARGRNLTNHELLGSTLDSFAYFYVVQRPITYGVTLGVSFGG